MDPIKVAASTMLAMLALSDLRTRRLPNLWVAVFVVLYFVETAVNGSTRALLSAHLAAGALSLTIGALLFHLRWLGGGDVKFAAAVFLWCGPTYAMPVLLIVSVCGAFIGLSMLTLGFVLRGDALGGMARRLTWIAPARGVPYGVALAPGGVIAVLLQPAARYRETLATLGSLISHHPGFALLVHARLA